jgi:hypothetical protein
MHLDRHRGWPDGGGRRTAPRRVPGVGQATKVVGSYDVIVTQQARSIDELAGPESADAGLPRRRTHADLPGGSAVESRSP